MFGPWKASVVTVRKKVGFPPGIYCAANCGLVRSGLVAEGVMMERLASLRIGVIALAEPLISGPIAATTFGLDTSLRALVAAWAGSYCPAVAVALFRIIGFSV